MIVHIGGDYGGNVQAYAVYTEWLIAQGAEVWFVGPCASACTALLAVPNGCATDRAEFQFHAATTRPATQTLLAVYPDWVRQWIGEHGGLSERWIYLRVPEVFDHLRRCPS